jgi:hypothetical protein
MKVQTLIALHIVRINTRQRARVAEMGRFILILGFFQKK